MYGDVQRNAVDRLVYLACGRPGYGVALTLQQRMYEVLAQETYGSTETTRAIKAEVMTRAICLAQSMGYTAADLEAGPELGPVERVIGVTCRRCGAAAVKGEPCEYCRSIN